MSTKRLNFLIFSIIQVRLLQCGWKTSLGLSSSLSLLSEEKINLVIKAGLSLLPFVHCFICIQSSVQLHKPSMSWILSLLTNMHASLFLKVCMFSSVLFLFIHSLWAVWVDQVWCCLQYKIKVF